MTTLVTGANGFIGSHLVRHLLDLGEPVRALLKPGSQRATLAGLDIERFEGDIRDPEAVRAAVRGCAEVYHLASYSQLWARDRRVFVDVNFHGTENLLQAACDEGVQRLVYTSSCAFLGRTQRARGDVGDETDVPTRSAGLGPYSRVKFRAERRVLDACSALDCVVVNPSIPLGGFDTAPSPQGLMVRNFLAGTLRGYLERVLNLVDARDCARGHVLAMREGRPGRRYILGGENLPLSGLLARIEEHTGIPRPSWSVPYPLALLSARLMEWGARWSGNRPQASLEGVRSVRHSFAFSSARAEAELGYKPRPLREAIAAAVAWQQGVLGKVPASSLT